MLNGMIPSVVRGGKLREFGDVDLLEQRSMESRVEIDLLPGERPLDGHPRHAMREGVGDLLELGLSVALECPIVREVLQARAHFEGEPGLSDKVRSGRIHRNVTRVDAEIPPTLPRVRLREIQPFLLLAAADGRRRDAPRRLGDLPAACRDQVVEEGADIGRTNARNFGQRKRCMVP